MNLPKFQPEIDPNPHPNHPDGFTCVQCPHRFYAVCVACGEDALRDEATKLCRPCWRAWRWSEAAVGVDQRDYERQKQHKLPTFAPNMAAIAKVPEMVRMLRKLEWQRDGDGWVSCIECLREQPNHAPNCEVAAILKDLPEET